jgi:hypothetical protein
MLINVGQDADNHLVLLNVTPGKAFVYYSGSAWNKGMSGFQTRAAWDDYARREQLDFTVPGDAP